MRRIESLYKVCNANPLWSPREKKEKEKNLKETKMLMCVFIKFFEEYRLKSQIA